MDENETAKAMKNKFNSTHLLLIIFIGVMLILVFLILKTMFIKNNYVPTRNSEANQQVSVESKASPGFAPNQNDNMVKFEFITPTGMVEDSDLARRSGVYRIYKSSDSKLVSPESVVSISFTKNKNKALRLNDFILTNAQNLKQIFPDLEMAIGLIHLPKIVTEKFDSMDMPYSTILFNLTKGASGIGHSCAIFFLETPDGFWSINWTAPIKILQNEKGRERSIFLSVIAYTMFSMRNPYNPKDMLIVI